MSLPQLRLDFVKNLPSSMNIFLPNEENNEEKKHSPDYIKCREVFIDQIFSKDTLSKQIFDSTNWAVLLRDIPEVDGIKDINNYSWMVGHYQWDELIRKVIELTDENSPDTPYGIYLVPTLGQSLYARGPERCELTYNAYISPVDQAPFEHLIQRTANSENEGKDEEIFNKGAKCTFKSLEDLHLVWDPFMSFTKEHFDFIEEPIKTFILKPQNGYLNILNKMSDDEFQEWFDTTMGNFLPLVPYPLSEEGKLTKLPLILIDPIECTPSMYKELMEIVDKINQTKYTMVIKGERVRAIKGVINFWQFDPSSIADELLIFANNGYSIPEGSREFNNLFFQQYSTTRYFIIDEILGGFLNIKRESDEFEMWKDAPFEIDEELEKFDKRIDLILNFEKQEFKDFFRPLAAQLKEAISFWFNDKHNVQIIYNEFKEQITRAMNELLHSGSIEQYLRISDEQNKDTSRRKWLSMYYNYEVLYCMWPTIYQNYLGVLHEGEENQILVALEDEMLKNISKTSSIPEACGRPIPPNK